MKSGAAIALPFIRSLNGLLVSRMSIRAADERPELAAAVSARTRWKRSPSAHARPRAFCLRAVDLQQAAAGTEAMSARTVGYAGAGCGVKRLWRARELTAAYGSLVSLVRLLRPGEF